MGQLSRLCIRYEHTAILRLRCSNLDRYHGSSTSRQDSYKLSYYAVSKIYKSLDRTRNQARGLVDAV